MFGIRKFTKVKKKKKIFGINQSEILRKKKRRKAKKKILELLIFCLVEIEEEEEDLNALSKPLCSNIERYLKYFTFILCVLKCFG